MDLQLDYSQNIDLEAEFEKLWSTLPSKMRVGKKLSKRYFLSSVKSKQDLEKIKYSLQYYLSTDRVRKGYIQNATTWFNNWLDWYELYKEEEYLIQKEKEKKEYNKKKYKELLEKMKNENYGGTE